MGNVLLPFLWCGLSLGLLLVLQRWLHAHMRGVALLATGNLTWATILYAIVLFPGVVLHELSHLFMATILGVETGKISLLPRSLPDGSVQLGYVEYFKGPHVGPLRESLIGGAPLLTGTAVVLLMAQFVFDITTMGAIIETGNLDDIAVAAREIWHTNDFFLWLYLLFSVGNAMMPSKSDRRAWPPFLVLSGIVVILLIVADLQEILLQGIAGPLGTAVRYLALCFTMVILVDILFIAVIALLEIGLGRLRGARVNYS